MITNWVRGAEGEGAAGAVDVPDTVAVTDAAGVKHQVEVSADSLLEAAALGLAAMKNEQWVDGTGPAATLQITVVQPVVTHSVPVQRVLRWLDGLTTSPKEKAKKERLKAMLGR